MPFRSVRSSTSQRPFSLVEGVRPVVILGAARSGTKFLRSLLGASRACTTIPYGISHVWRHGNHAYPHDALPASRGTEHTARPIRRTLVRLGGLSSDPSVPPSVRFLVEKTCANTLRVPFVDRVLPDARYVHIVRDGRDVTASSYEQWRCTSSFAVQCRKFLTAPKAGLHAGLHRARAWLRRSMRSDAPAATWGPRYPGIEADLDERPLLDVCARQWVCCVETCLDGLAAVPAHRQLTVRYESLVTSTAPLEELMAFLDLPDPEAVRAHYRCTVYPDALGRWDRTLTSTQHAATLSLLTPTLKRLGYAA